MARKDFAKVQAPQLDPRGAGNMRTLLVVAGMLIIVGGSFSGGFMLGEQQGQAQAEHAGKQHLLDEIKKQRHELNSLKKTAAKKKNNPDNAERQIGDLTFYNTLPNQKVDPAPLDTSQDKGRHANRVPTSQHKLPQLKKQSEPMGIFKLQLGSYQREEDADGLKERLKKKGFHGVVEQTMVSGLGLWFRVYTGPYPNTGMAEQARSAIQAKMHITGLLLREK